MRCDNETNDDEKASEGRLRWCQGQSNTRNMSNDDLARVGHG